MPKNTAPKGLPALFQPIDLTEGPCWKTILRFSFPIILSYLLQQVYSISDAAIVGQTLSGEQVAGCQRHCPDCKHLSAVCLRRVGRLLRHYLLQCWLS